MRIMFALAIMLSFTTMVACSSGGRNGGMPTEKPLVSGTVTKQGAAGFLVEENPAQQSGDTKCWAQVTGKTAVYRQAGKLVEKAAPGDIAVGQTVSIWPSGPVRESYPCQSTAGTVLILGQ